MSRSNVIDQVEEFLTRYHNGDSVLKKEAVNLSLVKSEKKLFGFKSETKVGSLPDQLGKAIARYEYYKDISPRLQYESAVDLLDLIERARAHRVIEERGLANRVAMFELENKQLKEQNSNLRQLNTRLIEENKRMHKLFPDDQKGKTEQGDVEE